MTASEAVAPGAGTGADDARPVATGAAAIDPGAVATGDRVLLLETVTGHTWLVRADGQGARQHRGLGIVDPDRLVGTAYGTLMRVGAKEVHVLRPSAADLPRTLRRKAQIITPKDASRIVFELGLQDGDHVLESGVGSGAATMSLAVAVGTGRVVVQELRQDFADWARGNMEAAGLEDRVEMHLGDLTQAAAPGVREAAAKHPFDALLLDQPEPWLALDQAWPLLAPGARIACYCPQVSQMESTVRRLRALGAADVRAMELIERAWEVKERGSRPAFEGLGHTAFLVFGRRLG